MQRKKFGDAAEFTEPVIESQAEVQNSNRPFAAGGFDIRDAGQDGLVQTQLLLTQHLFTPAASLSLQCGPYHGSSHRTWP
jgi:hypothetical protein